ncbi:MAG: tetratricopeptide repeat protein [Treponema sp.]|nr:tetratricopeptide repeat protein [Treponema sp.]
MTERSDILNNQAILFASDGDYSSAIACFKRAIIIDNQNYLLWYNLGVTYRDNGDYENARHALEKAFNMNPENYEVLETLATICLMEKRYDDTLFYCMLGLDLDECTEHFLNLAGVVYFQQEDYETASSYFESAVSINPYYKEALLNLKDTYYELGNKFGIEEVNKKLSSCR